MNFSEINRYIVGCKLFEGVKVGTEIKINRYIVGCKFLPIVI